MVALSYADLSDCELFSLLKGGNKAVYQEIYERYKGLLYIHAFKMLRDPDAAEDVVQELFTMLWVKREQIDVQKNLGAYLYTSVRNQILDSIAKQKVESRYLESLQSFRNALDCRADYQVREKELKALIEKEISALPEKMRVVFELSRHQHLSHREIAEQLNISEKTVKKQINNALKVLRVKLGDAVVVLYLSNYL